MFVVTQAIVTIDLFVEKQKMAETILADLIIPALDCTCRPTPAGVCLWEGFWNGVLLGETSEAPATARGNHFGPFVCVHNLGIFICHTASGNHWSIFRRTKKLQKQI